MRVMSHSDIPPLARQRARKLRSDMTKVEAAMWSLLRDFRARGARFRREVPIGAYIADFAWLAAGIFVEVDGDSQETDAGKMHDLPRDALLSQEGFRILRFDNLDMLPTQDHAFLEIEKNIAHVLVEVGNG